MLSLADLRAGIRVRGLLPDQAVTIKAVQPYGEHSVEVVFADAAGRIDTRAAPATNVCSISAAARGLA